MGVGWQEFVLILIVFLALIGKEKLETVAKLYNKTAKELSNLWNIIKPEIGDKPKDFRKRKMAG